MMLDKKQILVIFSFEFEMDHEVADKICNINRTFGPETANEHIVQWWFMKFWKEITALKMKSAEAIHWNLIRTKREDHWSWSSYIYKSC